MNEKYAAPYLDYLDMSVHPHQGRRFPLWESPALHKTRGCHKVAILWGGCKIMYTFCFKGDVRRFFYWLKVFIGPKLRQVTKGNFHRKAPKWVKNQAKGSKIHKIRTKWHPTYCGNPSILSTNLLWESTNSVLGATVGIHFLQIRPPTYFGNPSSIRNREMKSESGFSLEMASQLLWMLQSFNFVLLRMIWPP